MTQRPTQTRSPTTPAPAGTSYSFTLWLSGVDDLSVRFINALAEADCTGAMPGMRGGRVYLDFDRTDVSREEAKKSAIAAIESLGLGIRVTRVEDADEPNARANR